MLKSKGWKVNYKRVEKIWREEGLWVPKKQKKRRRIYLKNGACIRLRPLYQNHVWSYDCAENRLANGRKIKYLTVIDDFTRESLAIFTEKMLRKFIEDVGAKTAYITPGSSWENGFIERFNGTLRDELFNREVFYSLEEARVLIENFRREYNSVRPHSFLGHIAHLYFVFSFEPQSTSFQLVQFLGA